jgi:hypothetical protein
MHKLMIILALSLNLMACATSSNQPEEGAVVGIALGDSTTATDGNAAVGALIE